MGGAGHAAIFNTWRRSKAQILYWAPPLIGAYYLMTWANEQYVFLISVLVAEEFGWMGVLTVGCRNEWVNSKEGRLATAGDEE